MSLLLSSFLTVQIWTAIRIMNAEHSMSSMFQLYYNAVPTLSLSFLTAPSFISNLLLESLEFFIILKR